MSDENGVFGPSDSTSRLRADGLALMMKGAGYALAFCLALIVIGAILTGIAALLPEASKERPDPTPVSQLTQPAAEVALV